MIDIASFDGKMHCFAHETCQYACYLNDLGIRQLTNFCLLGEYE